MAGTADKPNMENSGITLFTATPMLAIAIILVVTFIIATALWRQRSTLLNAAHQQSAAQAAAGIIYTDAPTVRVVDSQRVGRLRKVIQLDCGSHVDILEAQGSEERRFRITLKAVLQQPSAPDESLAHIAVEFHGTSLGCGPLVEEVGSNEFVLPRALRDEPRSAVFHYRDHGDALDFMRIRIRAIDPQAQTAQVDVMQVCGYWPSGSDEVTE